METVILPTSAIGTLALPKKKPSAKKSRTISFLLTPGLSWLGLCHWIRKKKRMHENNWFICLLIKNDLSLAAQWEPAIYNFRVSHLWSKMSWLKLRETCQLFFFSHCSGHYLIAFCSNHCFIHWNVNNEASGVASENFLSILLSWCMQFSYKKIVNHTIILFSMSKIWGEQNWRSRFCILFNIV